MSKKVLSVLLLLSLVLGSVSTAFATEADLVTMDNVVVEDQIVSDDAEAIVEEDTIDQEVVQGVNMADIEEVISTGNFAITPRAVGYVFDFAGLKAAVEDPTVNIAVVMNDIQMEKMLIIKKDMTFLAPAGATLTSAPDSLHFVFKWGIPSAINLEFSQVILDGNGERGGIFSEALSLHLKGAIIQNCVGAAIDVSKGDLVLETSTITNNSGTGIHGIYSNVTINNSEVNNNNGGIYLEDGSLNLTDSLINGNKGSGISARSSKVNVANSIISNNRATFRSGGGIYLLNPESTLTVSDSQIIGNIAEETGGGMHLEFIGLNTPNENPEAIIINSQILDNKAENGGGISIGDINRRNQHILELAEGTIISGNVANEKGGAIYLRLSDALVSLTVSKDVIFSNNTAAEGYFMTDSVDIALHNQKILTTSFTEPFTYGYNNFDISYTKGDKLAAVTVNYFIKMGDTTPLASMAAYAGQTIGAISAPADPTMDNLVFIGWADEDNVFYDADSVITDDLNLYAVWKLK